MLSAEHHVVVIDDHEPDLEIVLAHLQHVGLHATGFTAPRRGLDYVIDSPPSLVIVDLYMPEMDGIEICRRLWASLPELPLIAMTEGEDKLTRIYVGMMRDFGARRVLAKPIKRPTLTRAVRAVLGLPVPARRLQ